MSLKSTTSEINSPKIMDFEEIVERKLFFWYFKCRSDIPCIIYGINLVREHNVFEIKKLKYDNHEGYIYGAHREPHRLQ